MRSYVIIILFLLIGCAKTPIEPTVVNYTCPMGGKFVVEYCADGDTAILKDANNKRYILKSSEAASGSYYKNSTGVSIHEKSDEIIIELQKDKLIKCKKFD